MVGLTVVELGTGFGDCVTADLGALNTGLAQSLGIDYGHPVLCFVKTSDPWHTMRCSLAHGDVTAKEGKY